MSMINLIKFKSIKFYFFYDTKCLNKKEKLYKIYILHRDICIDAFCFCVKAA